jgi:RNA polymerase sigma-70 factor (ECF subfamily)
MDPRSSFGRALDNTTQSLIDAARSGDDSAWSELNVRYRRILSLLVRSNRPPSMRGRVGTEDVVQSTFLSAFRGLGGYEDRGRGSFLAWLKTILRNRIAQRLRQHAAERRDTNREEPLGESHSSTTAQDPSPSEIAARAESCSRLLEAVAELPSEHRDLIICHFFEGMSTRSMARTFDASETSVRRRLGKSLELLRKQMDRSTPDEPPD